MDRTDIVPQQQSFKLYTIIKFSFLDRIRILFNKDIKLSIIINVDKEVEVIDTECIIIIKSLFNNKELQYTNSNN